MTTQQTVTTREGLKLVAQICRREAEVELTLQAATTKRLLLHWGVRSQKTQASWDIPPRPAWPPGTALAGSGAVQSPFSRANGKVNLVIHLSPAAGYEALEFVLFFPEEKRWDNN